jgi:hypothetical protein
LCFKVQEFDETKKQELWHEINRIHRFGFVGFGTVVKKLGALILSCFLKWGLLRIGDFYYIGMPCVEKGEKEMARWV